MTKCIINTLFLWISLICFFHKFALAASTVEACSTRMSVTVYQQILNVLRTKDGQCDNYIIGEERRLSPYSTSAYNVRRNTEKIYTASIALSFSADETLLYPGSGYKNSTENSYIHKTYLKKVRDCVRDVEPYMLGPKGEQLKIEIRDGLQTNCRRVRNFFFHHPRRQIHRLKLRQRALNQRNCHNYHSIKIQDESASDSRNYTFNISCGAIIHEILHILGLVDEYEERRQTYPKYDCRVIQTDTMMASNFIQKYNNIVNVDKKGSLLAPNHFYAILYGECSTRENVRLYRQCAKLAYDESSDCFSQKIECEKQNVLGY